jgi:CheY-like chemotaxis protein
LLFREKSILVIDDDPAAAQLVATVALAVVGRVSVATSGAQGLYLARQAQPDLILCDVEMPSMDGFEVRRQLAAEPTLGRVPFVFISANAKASQQLAGLRVGADDYLTKPVSAETLASRIIHLLEQPPRPHAEPVPAAPTASLSGLVSTLAIADLLQLLETSRATGRLSLTGAATEGYLDLVQGEVTSALAGPLEEEDAAFTLLWLTEGRFAFEPLSLQPVPSASGSRPRMPVRKLLMDGAFLFDERRQLAAEFPAPDQRVQVRDQAAALALFPGEAARVVFRLLGPQTTISVRDLARGLGIGLLRCGVLVARARLAQAVSVAAPAQQSPAVPPPPRASSTPPVARPEARPAAKPEAVRPTPQPVRVAAGRPVPVSAPPVAPPPAAPAPVEPRKQPVAATRATSPGEVLVELEPLDELEPAAPTILVDGRHDPHA